MDREAAAEGARGLKLMNAVEAWVAIAVALCLYWILWNTRR